MVAPAITPPSTERSAVIDFRFELPVRLTEELYFKKVLAA